MLIKAGSATQPAEKLEGRRGNVKARPGGRKLGPGQQQFLQTACCVQRVPLDSRYDKAICFPKEVCAHIHVCTCPHTHILFFLSSVGEESRFLCQAKGKQQASTSGTVPTSPPPTHRILSINDTLKRFLAQPLPDLDHPGEPGQKYTLFRSASAGGQLSAESLLQDCPHLKEAT